MSMDYYEVATRRKSTRDFKKRLIREPELAMLREHFEQSSRLVPEIEMELYFLEEDAAEKMGTCGGYHQYMIKAPNYVLILSEVKEHYLENAGYVGEELVLKMTDMGLDTCWITINNQEELKERLGIDSYKEAVCLIAFGEEAGFGSQRLDIKHPGNIIIKERTGFVAPKLSIDHAIYQAQWGKEEKVSARDSEDIFLQSCIAACCAPSFLNLQPYRFIHDKNKLILVGLSDHATNYTDAHLNYGIVMRNFASVMRRHSTLANGWILQPPEDHYSIPEEAKIIAYFPDH